ncbi:hypothetical protein E3H11_28620 [Bradyrhizobium brasilense]|nr:hypothetical protein [Bradyrhizobium brasilense]
MEIGGYGCVCRCAAFVRRFRHASHPVIPGREANPESRDSGFDASHRPGMTIIDGIHHSLNRACGGSASPRSSWRTASGRPMRRCRIAGSASPRPSA